MKPKVIEGLRYLFFVVYVAALLAIIYGARSFTHFHESEDLVREKRIRKVLTEKSLTYYEPS